jgi:two-component system CheB/CheR fusion protein
MLTAEPHHIIAIGASAGGMEEINLFFDHTPLDGVSYVIIQHLSADFKSRMVELLARHSKLIVKEAENGITVKSNQVYLIPHDKYMEIHENKLYLTEKGKTHTTHLTINTFFNSLAVNSGTKAIGIILSGLGNDGTEGIRAIKKAGGMVMARKPETTNFGSMPSNAIATGLVDFVLEPEIMPSAIEDYIKYGGTLIADSKDDEKNLANIITLVKEKSPLDFSDYKQTTILRRTKRRAAYSNFTSLENYYEFLKTRPDEIDALTKDYLISVTSFFRDKEAFDFIQKKIFPDIIEKIAVGEELKMWVAGCATGEEVYSLAILLHELLAGSNKDTVVKIFATDIDSVALMHAGKGVYNNAITKNISPDRIEKHFLKEGESYRIKPVIRKMVIFAQHDLVKNPPYCNMHFISCRNLVIYMTPVLQKKVFSMLLFGLKMDGYLFLGSSENPMPIIKNLEIVNKKWKIYKNLETKRTMGFDAFLLPEYPETKRTPSSFSLDDTPKKSNTTLADAVNANLVNELDALVVCVDENNNVIQSYGDTTKYLLQKNFNSNLADLLPKPLAIAFNTLSVSALKTNKKATATGIKIKSDKLLFKVTLSVSPLTTKKSSQNLLMVTFSEDKLVAPAENTMFDETIFLDQYTINLEEEVKELKEKLHLTYEQLDASNENMQSFNEELLSSNEEMQSTNEEMQSVNEELDTINSNYQLKNKELLEINDDLNNYFRSNVNGQLFINNELRLMKFSPGAVNQINLLETDIGRPLSNISTNIKFETITHDVKNVLDKGSIITKEIETNNGKWYQMMTMPYIQQADNKRNGAIITFNDITELKNTQLELANKNKSLVRINADLDHFVYAASHDLLGPLSNIETSINIMSEMSLSEKKLADFLKIINTSVKTFRSLITDIATIAKVEGDMITMEIVDMDDIINNIEWSLENKIKSSGAVIIRDLEIRKILFSKKNMRSIVYNLVSNAIKFKGDKSPVVRVNTLKNGDYIILTVTDNGMGIPENKLNKIFEMYGRLKQDIEGHGIGLYLAKKIVDAAGGYIEVESEVGKGSRFMIYFKTEYEHPKSSDPSNAF